MTDINVKQFAETLNQSLEAAESTEAVDEIFAAVKAALPAETCKAVVNILEKDFLTGVEESLAKDLRKQGPAAFKKELTGDLETNAEAIRGAQVGAQILFHVREIKGNATSPLIKAFLAAAAKLTDEEYNGEECVIKPALAVVDAIVKQEGLLKPNPLRKKTPATNNNKPQGFLSKNGPRLG